MLNLITESVRKKINFKKIKKQSLILLKENKLKIVASLALIPIFLILYKIYIPRINEFGCFDDCNNFMRGYFVLRGNSLFSEVFSGHQPLGSYFSTIIQLVTNPQNIFELVLRHRQFMLMFALIFNTLLILRFGAKFIIFTLIYEFSKFYIFGDRFLGDGMIVYALIYIVGLIFLRYKKLKLYLFDFILVAILTWFIIFMRAPYVPVALFVYFIFLWSWPIKRNAIFSVVLFTVLSALTILVHDIGEYFYNVFYFNFQINLPAEANVQMFGPKYLHWFFYPVYIFFYGPMNLFKMLLVGINALFLILFLNLIWNRKLKLAFFIILVLGLSNIRTVLPGEIFYGAFHMLSWYGILIFITVELLFEKSKKLLFYAGGLFLGFLFLFFILSPDYFGTKNVNTHEDFIIHYGGYLQEGEVLKALSSTGDTLFIDGSDDLIYWVSGLSPSYKYSWYTSSMHMLDKYSKERIKMFREGPPTFYREYGYCTKKADYKYPTSYLLPEFIKDDYTRLYTEDEPSCIYVKNEKLSDIAENQWKKAAEFHFYPPPETL